MKAQFTAGPWHVGGNGLIVYAANGYAICDVKTFHGRNDDDRENVKLIAAAPILYQALLQATNAIDHLLEERPMLAAKVAGSTTLGNHRAECRSALAKATA